MIETIVKVEGMACGMCEAHVNDAVRAHFAVKKVSSSHAKGETRIESAEALEEGALRRAIEETGYRVLGVESREKKGLFSRRKAEG